MRYPIRYFSAFILLAFCMLGCAKAKLPAAAAASATIQAILIENGDMPGGNRLDIHRLDITRISPGTASQSAWVEFQIDFTRYPTSGLPPEYQQYEPMRQTENHRALLVYQKDNWVVQDLSLR